MRGVIFPALWVAPLCGGRSYGIAQYRTRWGGVVCTACARYNAQPIKCIASARPAALWPHPGGRGAVAMRCKDTDTVRAVAVRTMFKIPTSSTFLFLALLLLTLSGRFDSPTHCPMGTARTEYNCTGANLLSVKNTYLYQQKPHGGTPASGKKCPLIPIIAPQVSPRSPLGMYYMCKGSTAISFLSVGILKLFFPIMFFLYYNNPPEMVSVLANPLSSLLRQTHWME